jgi:hypothetical protein
LAATYLDSLPTERDRVRSDLGGRITILPASDPLLTDEHIDAVLTLEGSRASAVAYLARELVVRFAHEPVKVTAGDMSVDYSPRIGLWEALAARNDTSDGSGALSFVPATYGSADTIDEYSRVPRWWES